MAHSICNGHRVVQGLVMLILAACGSGKEGWVVPTPVVQEVGHQVHIIGVIRYSDLEGGFYAIHGADGVTYTPTNLPTEFRKDALLVEADAYRRDDVAGIHQVGPIVALKRIRAR